MINLKVIIQSAYKKFLSLSKTRHLFVYVIFWFLLVQITASGAQTTLFNERIIPIPHPITSLLRSKIIHRELILSEAKIDKVEKAVSEFDLPLFRLRDLPPRKRNELATPLINRLRNKLYRILSDRQMERFNQLILQASGIDVILEPEITLKLNLSPQQTIKIRTLLKTLYSKINSLRNKSDLGSALERFDYIQNLQTETWKSILAVLNSYQQSTLTTLMRIPFNFSQVKSVACKAPEFEIDTWFNSPPVKLSEQKGKVTVVHFYAFGCGNCIRSLPYYNDWYNDFPKSSFSIIGIHRPETEQERIIEKVREKAVKAHMEYPIAIDNESLTWDSWANNVWPSIYIIDKNGYVRYWWYGELNWQGTESEKFLRERIRELIDEPFEAQAPLNF